MTPCHPSARRGQSRGLPIAWCSAPSTARCRSRTRWMPVVSRWLPGPSSSRARLTAGWPSKRVATSISSLTAARSRDCGTAARRTPRSPGSGSVSPLAPTACGPPSGRGRRPGFASPCTTARGFRWPRWWKTGGAAPWASSSAVAELPPASAAAAARLDGASRRSPSCCSPPSWQAGAAIRRVSGRSWSGRVCWRRRIRGRGWHLAGSSCSPPPGWMRRPTPAVPVRSCAIAARSRQRSSQSGRWQCASNGSRTSSGSSTSSWRPTATTLGFACCGFGRRSGGAGPAR